MKFEHFDYRVKSGKNWDLYVSTYGYAYIMLWGMTGKLKKYFPNEKGYIWIGTKRINFKRLLYHVVYPKVKIKDKYVVKNGFSHDIRYLYALSKSEYLIYKKNNCKIKKNAKTGVCQLHSCERNFES